MEMLLALFLMAYIFRSLLALREYVPMLVTKTLLQLGISDPVFYGDLVMTSKQLLEYLILVINSKR